MPGTNWEGKPYLLPSSLTPSLSLPRTPMHYAAASAQYQCVLSLVANGANLTVVDSFKRTPLHYAAASDTDGK